MRKNTKAWAIVSNRKDGKIMLVAGQLPIFWLKSVAEKENRLHCQGKVVLVEIKVISQ